MSACKRFPVEIWLRIFRLLTHTELVPVRDATFVEDLRLSSVGKFIEPRIPVCNTERMNISLVCRYFCDILKEEGAKVIVVGREGKMKRFSYYSVYEAHRLEADSVPLHLPSAMEQQIFPALEVLNVYWPYQYLESFLYRTPNLRVLLISFPHGTSAHPMSILDHPVAQHLTHLSIFASTTPSAQRVTIPSLSFLHLTFRDDLQAGLPWRFPSLRSLCISGYIQGPTFEALTPFLIAHSATVTRLYDDFRVLHSIWTPSTSIKHFKNLNVYAFDLINRSDNPDPPPLLSTTGLRPLTVLWIHAPIFIGFNSHGAADMRIRWLKWEVTTLGYSVERIVLDHSWDGFKNYYERSDSQVRHLRFSHELERLDTPRCPVFDRHLVRFRPID